MRYREEMVREYRMIWRYTGVLTIGTGGLLLVPVLFLPFYLGEAGLLQYFLAPAAAAVLLGLGLRWIGGRGESAVLRLTSAAPIILISWTLALVFHAAPFVLGNLLSPLNALFEAMSGWTTTGLSMVDVAATPRMFLLWRSLMQFYGGAGLAVIMLAAVIGPEGSGLYTAEGRNEYLVPHIRHSAKLIMRLYSGFVLLGVLAYRLTGLNWFDAVNHSMGALSTGGFSTHPASIGFYHSPAVEAVTIVLMILGMGNFATNYLLVTGKIRSVLRNGEVRLMVLVIALSTPLVTLGLLGKIYTGLGASFRHGIFQVVSALSTTGFQTTTLGGWPHLALFILTMLMLLGGGACSTAGGIKLYRGDIALKALWWELRAQLHPSGEIFIPTVWRRKGRVVVTKAHLAQVLGYIFFFMLLFAVGVTIFLCYGYPLQDAMFEFASALGNTGLTVGTTRPDMPAVLRWTAIIGMGLGRLEITVVFVALLKMGQDLASALHLRNPFNGRILPPALE